MKKYIVALQSYSNDRYIISVETDNDDLINIGNEQFRKLLINAFPHEYCEVDDTLCLDVVDYNSVENVKTFTL